MNLIQLNLGCGSVRPIGWINTDSSINANLQRLPILKHFVSNMFKTVQYDSSNFKYMNLNRLWQYRSNSIDIVYASHLFEHLSLKASELFLKESYRCLRPGGVLRIVVPDLYQICKKYVNEYEAQNKGASEHLMWAINMHREGQYKHLNLFKKLIFELQGYPHQHKYMYDEYSLKEKFVLHGYTNVLSQSYGVSSFIDNIHDVEGDREHYLSVYLEAKK